MCKYGSAICWKLSALFFKELQESSAMKVALLILRCCKWVVSIYCKIKYEVCTVYANKKTIHTTQNYCWLIGFKKIPSTNNQYPILYMFPLQAALLHDTVEDTDTSIAELELAFGPTVARIVQEVTDDKALPKHERKRLQVEHAPHCSHQAKLVKLADKLYNLRDLNRCTPTGVPLVLWSIVFCCYPLPWLCCFYYSCIGFPNKTLVFVF